MYHFDQSKHGQCATRPDLRKCPLRDSYHKLVRNVLQVRSDDSEGNATLQIGELGVIIDGGRMGNASRLLAPWKVGTTIERMAKRDVGEEEPQEDAEEDAIGDESGDAGDKPGFVSSLLQIAFTEASLGARRKFVRGTASIKQMLSAHIVSCKKLCLPERPRLHYPGTNSGDLISGVKLPPLDKEWHLSVG